MANLLDHVKTMGQNSESKAYDEVVLYIVS